MRHYKEELLVLPKHFNKYGNSPHVLGIIKDMEKIQIKAELPPSLSKYQVNQHVLLLV